MKNQTETIHVDSPVLKWLIGKLQEAPQILSSASELEEGMIHLLAGTSDAMLLWTGEGESGHTAQAQIQCGDLTVLAASRRVIRGGKEVMLTPKEFDILWFLASHRGQVFTKEQIYQAVWDRDYLLDDSNIMAFIRKLRKKIEPEPDNPQYILTVWGIGYKFSDRL